MNAYIFVAAAVFSVIPLLVIFKVNINKLIEDPSQMPKVQKHFLIGVALSKIVPVILLIYGMIKITTFDMTSLIVPLTVIVIVVAYGYFFISSHKNVKEREDAKIAVNTLTTIAKPLIFSIPLMAIVFLFMATQ